MKTLAFFGSFGLMLTMATQVTTASTTSNTVAVQPSVPVRQFPTLGTQPSASEDRALMAQMPRNIGVIYVSNFASSNVTIYRADRTFSLIGMITTGIRNPEQMAVDRFGTLYVCNIGANTVTEYARGSTSPTKTLRVGLTGPSGIAVSPNGTVYVSNSNPNPSLVSFAPGSDTPTLVSKAIQFPLGLVLDKDGNLFVGAQEAGVYEIPAGSTTPKHLNIKTAQFVIGVAIGPSGELDVSGQANNNRSSEVDKFAPPYSGAPNLTISTGANATPYYLTAPGNFLLVPLQGLNRVNIYYGQSTAPFATITNGLNEPVDAVYSPGS